jgi:hypothetical protein
MVSIWRSIWRCLSGGRFGERFIMVVIPPGLSGRLHDGRGRQGWQPDRRRTHQEI